MNKLLKKLAFTSVAAVATAATLTTTTYAWFARNKVVWTEDIDFSLDSDIGLAISLDDQNWSQSLTSAQIHNLLLENINKNLTDDEKLTSYSQVKYPGVSVEHNLDGSIKYDADGKMMFTKLDKNLFMAEDERETDLDANPKSANNCFSQATTSDYISFSIYLKPVKSGDYTGKYSLRFGNNNEPVLEDRKLDVIKSVGSKTVTLVNTLNSNGTEYGPTKENKTIDVDVKDAMRIAINTSESANVFELSTGLGSSALEGNTDNNDPSKNAMYTYFNSLHEDIPLTKAGQANGEAFNTKSESDLYTTSFGTFEYNESLNDFNSIKLDVYVWLEGWDADFFLGIPADALDMKISLAFTIEEIN